VGHYYHHLNFEDRVLLNRLLEEQFPKSRIAQLLGVARSTIYREIKRNHFTHRRSEFMKYQWLQSCLMTAVSVCEPGLPYQKGTIENGNGTLRAELPRATDINAYQPQAIQRITDEINHRPLRCLGYQTPAEWFAGATAS